LTYLFIIQGEGRGHMTQAVSLAMALESNGHNIQRVYLGRSPQRKVPGFISTYFGIRMRFFRSPNFLRTQDKKGVNVLSSILYNALLLPYYIYEIIRLAFIIRRSSVNGVVNFYDAIGGFAYFFSFSRKPFYAISHQYFLEHPDFRSQGTFRFQGVLLRLYSAFTSLGVKKRLALSFTESSDLPQKRLFVVPPLLRKEIYEINSTRGNYTLVYVLNPGLLVDVKDWCLSYPERDVLVFTDAPGFIENPPSNLRIEPLGGASFMNALAGCETLVCTAGFETVAEAAYLGKKILVIPSENHYEQECNAADAVRAGVAMKAKKFDPAVLFGHAVNESKPDALKNWFDRSHEMIIGHFTYPGLV
jgi:uncharacterized protein (TIGR00661 family)